MEYFTFGELRKFINSASNIGVTDDTPIIIKIGDSETYKLTGDDIYTDIAANHTEIDINKFGNKRMLFIQI